MSTRSGTLPIYDIVASASMSVALAAFLPPSVFFMTFVVTGHAHFVAAGFYQWRAGKMTSAFVIAMLLIAIGAIAFITTAAYDWQVAVAGSFFIAHHMFDEFRLLGYEISPRRFIEVLAPALMYGSVFLVGVFGQTTATMAIGLIAFVALAVALLCILLKTDQYVTDHFTLHMSFLFLLLAYFFFNPGTIPPQALIGTLIMYHYIKWYFYSFRRIPTGVARRAYVGHMVAVNAIVVCLFMLSLSALHITALIAWFSPQGFFIMGIVHNIASFVQYYFPSRHSYAIARS